jgi:mannose/fructose-specific phosphotransferase system component IIA
VQDDEIGIDFHEAAFFAAVNGDICVVAGRNIPMETRISMEEQNGQDEKYGKELNESFLLCLVENSIQESNYEGRERHENERCGKVDCLLPADKEQENACDKHR